MPLPFTTSDFLSVFAKYNQAVWPAQWVLVAAAIGAVFVVTTRRPWRHRFATCVLALFWAWAGLVYHVGFFAAINPIARGFGLLFLLQAGCFLWLGWRGRLTFAPEVGGARWWLGVALLVYALVVYPAIGAFAGHGWPRLPTFGVPCPVAIFTFGLLLWAARPCSRGVLAIPIVWSVIGGSAAGLLGMPEDLGLPVGALVAVGALWPRATVSRRLARP